MSLQSRTTLTRDKHFPLLNKVLQLRPHGSASALYCLFLVEVGRIIFYMGVWPWGQFSPRPVLQDLAPSSMELSGRASRTQARTVSVSRRCSAVANSAELDRTAPRHGYDSRLCACPHHRELHGARSQILQHWWSFGGDPHLPVARRWGGRCRN